MDALPAQLLPLSAPRFRFPSHDTTGWCRPCRKGQPEQENSCVLMHILRTSYLAIKDNFFTGLNGQV